MEIKEEESLSQEDITYNVLLNVKNNLVDLVNKHLKPNLAGKINKTAQ